MVTQKTPYKLFICKADVHLKSLRTIPRGQGMTQYVEHKCFSLFTHQWTTKGAHI